MFEFLTSLLGHPILFVSFLLVVMGVMCMTYEFILRLSGRKGGMGEGRSTCLGGGYPDDTQDDPPPPMPAKVPASPDSPNDGEL